ncbi:MAG: zinc ribbon domain-containing protein, partial [Butyrivibrio sp.]|nr:zinc ribbon domain-containing protein [Butyrivibrio sp.]
ELVHYFKVKANAFSESEVRQAAEEQARKIRYNDPEISCDYCGCKIDTARNKVCPHCGAPYDKDDEWTQRFNVKNSFVVQSTKEIIAKREEKAQKETILLMKKIKKRIILLLALFFGFMAIGLVLMITEPFDEIRKSEELNDSDRYHYTEVDYEINGDGVIYDDGNVKITVTGIYNDEDTRDRDGVIYGSVKVGFRVENNLDKNVHVYMKCNSINKVSEDYEYIFAYDVYKKHSDVTVYEEIYSTPNYIISEMIFSEIDVYSTDYEYHGNDTENVILTTTADFEYPMDLSEAEVIYSNEKVTIYARMIENYSDENRLSIYVENKTDKAFMMDITDFKEDGKTVSSSITGDSYLPAEYTYVSKDISVYGEDYYETDLSGKTAEFNISFTCKEDPSYDFSTGYVSLDSVLK